VEGKLGRRAGAEHSRGCENPAAGED